MKQESQTTITILQKKESAGYSLAWKNLSYKVETKNGEFLVLKNMNGFVKPGSLVAILGASGAGKSSFLDVISNRKKSLNVSGEILINGSSEIPMKHVSRYCTQEDALFGNLTVRETLRYAAKFNLSEKSSKFEIEEAVNQVMKEFGLEGQADTIIGTPLRKGCSGGQIRRVSCASQVIGMQDGILFLDEPTSGLDSVAASSVIESVKRMCERYNTTAIATIHQPSTDTFNLFTHVLIIAQGSTVYFGPREQAVEYFSSIGKPIPTHCNPSDIYLQMTNIDFHESREVGLKNVEELVTAFANSDIHKEILNEINSLSPMETKVYGYQNGFISQTSTLISRALLNATKNPISYWVRVAMYTALALLMGSTWYNMDQQQQRVTDRLVALNFSVAFLAFMSVAGIPAFLEERLVFLRERANGLYGVESYLLSNFLVSIPFLFIISVAFSAVGYFLMGLQATAEKFFIFVAYMFVMLMIAEAQTVFISVALPIFVAALTIAAFTNGLWMVVNGFGLIKISDIPAGWRYTMHQIDFQKYSFESIFLNEFRGLTFDCAEAGDSKFACMVPSQLNEQGKFTGEDVISYYEHDDASLGKWLGIMFAILVFFKLATYFVMKLQGTKTK